MRKALFLSLLLAAPAAMADAPGYRLRLDSSVAHGKLTVVPYVSGPAGSRLRYEMVSAKQGGAGRSSTSQSGTVKVGDDGSAKLATLSLGVHAEDRYLVTVKVFDGAKLVAQDRLEYPR